MSLRNPNSCAILWLAAASVCLQAQPRRTLHVAADGTAPFRTVQSAIDAAPLGNVLIQIAAGEYREAVAVHAAGVELLGLGARPDDVVLVDDHSASTSGGTSHSATLTMDGDDFSARNLTIANDFEQRHPRSEQGSQAVALLISGDRAIVRHVRLLGYQDTLYANSKTCHGADETGPCLASRQYFADCYIAGHVDFIFGDAKAVFDRCEIHAMAHSLITITAQSRLRPQEDSGYLFLHCTVTAEPGAADILLGRPWRADSTVAWVDTDFQARLDSRGWLEWDGRLATSDYAEYGSHGQAGDLAKRAAPSYRIKPADLGRYTAAAWLAGSDSWDPQKMP